MLAAGLEHRFEAGEVAGHTAGNLLLGAMMRECGGDLIAVLDALGEALGTVGRVLPAAVNPVTLLGETSEGWVRGQVEVKGDDPAAALRDFEALAKDTSSPTR